MRVFEFVRRQKAEFSVETLCACCRISTSGFYDWAARTAAGPTPAEYDEEELVTMIRLVHKESRRRYGWRRVTAQLRRDGVTVNHKAVERLMAREGLQGLSGRRKVRTTVRDPRPLFRPTSSSGTSRGTSSTGSGSATPPTSRPTRAGSTSPRSSTSAAAGCSAGRSPTTCAPRICTDALSDRGRGEGRQAQPLRRRDLPLRLWPRFIVKPRNGGLACAQRGCLTGSSA